MSIHIEGMGVFGSLLAWSLYERDVPFTWNDIRSKNNAWQACTGAVFPTGHARDNECLELWHQLRYMRNVVRKPNVTEVGAYWYSQKTPPHGGRYRPEAEVNGMRLAPARSLHFNAQQLVAQTRMAFADQERARSSWPSGSGRLVIAHGFGARLDHVVWGWSKLVELKYDESAYELDLYDEEERVRPCFYFREGRFVMAYAFPVPGERDLWYAGSSLITQKEPRELEVEGKYQTWMRNVRRLSSGNVEVVKSHQTLQGWRPAPDKLDNELCVLRSDGAIMFPSCWHNGVRIWPAIELSFWELAGPLLGVATEPKEVEGGQTAAAT